MADRGLLFPGIARAEGLCDESLVRALVVVELAWARAGGADERTLDLLRRAAGGIEAPSLVDDLESGGNALIPLLGRWRAALDADQPLLHTGLTSQDVVDTALMLLARRAVGDALGHLDRTIEGLSALVEAHADAPVAARTLGQRAEATTFGLRFASVVAALAEARAALAGLSFPVSFGGPAGTARGQDPDRVAAWARDLELDVPALPWHTTRGPVLRLAAAGAEVVATLGKFGGDVIAASRDEVGELAESGGGVSSSMPHKRNPVRSILLRRSAIAVPGLVATLTAAAGLADDQRPTGAWHAEWPALVDLLRHLVVSTSLAADLVGGLGVDEAAGAAHVDGLTAADPAAIGRLIAAARERSEDRR